jgi:DNA-binding phage protein
MGKNEFSIPSCPEYNVWQGMWCRCKRPANPGYRYYGGRGISVCHRWRDFYLFIKDMGLRPSLNHQLDRINVDGNYEPGNCRWVTTKQQGNNKRNNVRVEIDGKVKTIAEWCEHFKVSRGSVTCKFKILGDWKKAFIAVRNGVSHRGIHLRYRGVRKNLGSIAKRAGVDRTRLSKALQVFDNDAEKAVEKIRHNKKLQSPILVVINGDRKTAREWCKQFGISFGVAWQRVRKNGWSWKRAITAPAMAAIDRNYKRKQIKIGRQTKGFGQWCRHFGISASTVWKRLQSGLPIEEAFRKPVDTKMRNGRAKQKLA